MRLTLINFVSFRMIFRGVLYVKIPVKPRSNVNIRQVQYHYNLNSRHSVKLQFSHSSAWNTCVKLNISILNTLTIILIPRV